MSLYKELRGLDRRVLTLKYLRTNRGLSQEDIARKANISLRQYQNIESGESIPRVDAALRIANALETDINDIANWYQGELEWMDEDSAFTKIQK